MFSLFLYSGYGQSTDYTIKGAIISPPLTGVAKLIKVDLITNKQAVIDSVILINNTFLFKGTISCPGYYTISIPVRYGKAAFILQGGEYKIDFASDKYTTSKIIAPAGSMQEKYESNKIVSESMNSELNAIHKAAEQEKDEKLKIKILDKTDKVFESIIQYQLKQIREYKGTLLSHIIASEKCFMFEREFYYMDTVVQILKEDTLQTYFKESVIKKYNELKTRDIRGTFAPDFTLPDLQGKPLTLSNFKGKIILLDFWASWCAPCRKKNVHLMEIYNRVDKSKFEIISVSLDDKLNLWKDAVSHDGITWLQVVDIAGFKASKTRELYHVLNVPTLFLIDRKGKIVSVNPKLDDVEKYVEAN